MASSHNENHASEFVTELEKIQEKEEVPLTAGGGGGGEEATAAEAEGHLAAGGGGGGKGATAAETEGEEEATAAEAEGHLAAGGGGGEGATATETEGEEEATAAQAEGEEDVAGGGSQKKSTYTQVLMASSNNEIHASNFVNGMEIVEEKEEDDVPPAAAREEEEEGGSQKERVATSRQENTASTTLYDWQGNMSGTIQGNMDGTTPYYWQGNMTGTIQKNMFRNTIDTIQENMTVTKQPGFQVIQRGRSHLHRRRHRATLGNSNRNSRTLSRQSSSVHLKSSDLRPLSSHVDSDRYRSNSAAAAAAGEEEEEETTEEEGDGKMEEADGYSSGVSMRRQRRSNDNAMRPVWEKRYQEQYWEYLPLLKALLRGDWKEAEGIIDEDEDAVTARITQDKETALHVVVRNRTGKSIDFVKYLMHLMMSRKELALTDVHGYTALNSAARFGNTKAVKIIAKEHPESLYIRSKCEWLPVHRAAQSAHKDTFSYLWKVTEKDHTTEKATEEGIVVDQPKPYKGQSGVELLLLLIGSGFYDEALNLVRGHPDVAKSHFAGHAVSEPNNLQSQLPKDDSKSDRLSQCPLGQLTKKLSAFSSGSRLTYCQRLLYNYVPVKLENDVEDQNRGDIENPTNNSQVIAYKYNWTRLRGNFSISAKEKLMDMLWKVLELSVPYIKHIREQKLMHDQALRLVKCLCQEISSLEKLKKYESLVKGPLLEAASLGICEIVEEIIDSFPLAIVAVDEKSHSIFHLAVINRQENVFNLLYQMSEYKQYITRLEDNHGNIILHLAGKLAPQDKLNLVPGAALQMQRELQWFKEVEKLVNPSYIEKKNDYGETPSMVFTRAHKDLVVQGEKWMNERSSSCTIVAALIASVVFTAAITVPGGNNGASGLPIFSKEKAFIVFVVSDAISLFTSTTSLLMFLSILTSRYAESDFLYVLPNRLIIGLVTLFFSITTMILAFSSTLYLVSGLNKAWTLIPVAALACLPIFSFVSLQFPLLVDLISSTYGPGIFGKKSNRPFY